MSKCFRHRSVSRGAVVAASLVSLAGASLAMSGPAAADPPVPPNVWIQCSGFTGPNTTWPHPLTGCISRQGGGSGYTQRTAPGTETIFWNAPFQKGESIQLINIANQPLGPTGACPADHPFEVNVSGEIGPGANNLSRSPVRATICANATDFVLKPGTLFTIFKK